MTTKTQTAIPCTTCTADTAPEHGFGIMTVRGAFCLECAVKLLNTVFDAGVLVPAGQVGQPYAQPPPKRDPWQQPMFRKLDGEWVVAIPKSLLEIEESGFSLHAEHPQDAKTAPAIDVARKDGTVTTVWLDMPVRETKTAIWFTFTREPPDDPDEDHPDPHGNPEEGPEDMDMPGNSFDYGDR